MKELVKHIEVLLLENNCVVVPELGGFIAHYRAASYDKETGEFCPPMRTIGFNPQLTMNDGLLVQSYMRAYSTDFPDATRRIEKTVQALKEALYNEGEVQLNHVGTLSYGMNGTYEFEPAESAYFTPSLYGLQKFNIEELEVVEDGENTEAGEEKRTPHIPLTLRRWVKNAVAIAAAVLLFFVLSNQAENTYVDETDYASLGTEGLFNAIKGESMLSHNFSTKKKIIPTAIREEKVPARKPDATTGATQTVPAKRQKDSTTVVPKKAQKEKAPQKNKAEKQEKKKGKYHVIVASLNTANDAKIEAERLQKKGYQGVQVLESATRYRVSVGGYESQSDAYKKTNEMRRVSGMESAWVYTQE